MKTKYRDYVLWVIIPIFLGSSIYYLFCPEVYYVRYIDSIIGIDIHFSTAKGNLIMSFIRCYMLDFLWAFALMGCVYLITDGIISIKYIMVIVISFESTIEGLQILPINVGVFDIWDIIVEVIANILAIYFLSRRKCKYES